MRCSPLAGLCRLIVVGTINSLPAQPIPRRRRRLSAAEITAWETFLLAHAATTQAVEREAGSRLGLSLAEHHLLVQLARGADGGTRATDLAARSLHTKSGLTRAVDRLVAQGLVERRPCPTDGRGSFIRLTPRGRRVVVRAAPGHLRSIAAHFADLLSPQELDALTAALGRIASHR